MALDIVGLDYSDITRNTNLQKGIDAAQDFFNQQHIIPPIAYEEVLKDAEGKPCIKRFVEIWDEAHNIAIGEAFGDESPDCFPCLIWR